MRLRTTLLHVAVLLTSGCGSTGLTTSDGGTDAAKDGPSSEPEAACGGCNCGEPGVPSGNASPQQACALAQTIYGQASSAGMACDSFCESLNDGGAGAYFCTLPTAYVTAYQAAVGDGGSAADAGPDAGLTCPAWSGDVVVQCATECLGRRTTGIDDPVRRSDATLGDIFAGRAYLEEVSVHAFARLERELAAHGAPAALLSEARRARRDEVRHTAMTARLARRFGGIPRSPQAPGPTPARPLREIALENAVEGCVRETYGAVIGLIEARRSSDAGVRRAMERIGADECRHAELAWAVARWILPRLEETDRQAVQEATRAAVDALAAEGDPRVVSMLTGHVWERAA
jgi:hypothetical protein